MGAFGAAAGPAAYITPAMQTILSLIQFAQANKLKPGDRPELKMPDPLKDYYAFAENKASRSLLPGQARIEDQISQTVGNAVDSAVSFTGSGVEAGAMATAAYGNEINARRDLGIKAAEYRDQNETDLQNARLKMADFITKQFEVNQLAPWLNQTAAFNQMKSAAIDNLFGGVGGGLQTFMADKSFNDLFGTRKPSGLKEMPTKSKVEDYLLDTGKDKSLATGKTGVLPGLITPINGDSSFSRNSFNPIARLNTSEGFPSLDFNNDQLNESINSQIKSMLESIDFSNIQF